MPLRSVIHNDKTLTNVSLAYKNSEYIADAVVQPVVVKKSSDNYQIWDRDFRIPETSRANGGLAREEDFDISLGSYQLEKHALKGYISPDDQENYDIGSLRVDKTEYLTDKIMARKEKQFASLFTSTSWSLNVSLAAGAAFNSNTTTTNPIPVFDTGASTIIANSGRRPNFAIIPHDTYVPIKNHVSVLDRIKYTSREMTVEMLGGLLDVPEIHVPHAQEDSNPRGVAASLQSIFPNNYCFLGYKPGRPSPKQPSAMYKFMRSRPMVKRWVDYERESSEVVEVQEDFQYKIVASLSGYLIKDTI